ncbi:YihY/virulence factor BrkB family protein [Streptomyces zagrosensis]|uniref:Membrane protein n=1 Tax=Streptomyces zagrosensis TaxID=1042984 RepID=A0A7W9QCQ7_9ACTN|nr:YihY/virulence factor BrkB family protein [Streptomyces zagrosensis]MBB5937363.1 membrane protein [Streptomyces zagrosensis]
MTHETAPPSPRGPAGRLARRWGLPGRERCRTALGATPRAMWDDDVSDWAAALTYYAVLALLPALLVAVSLIGLAGPAATEELIDQVTAIAPAESGTAVRASLEHMAHQRSAAWALTVVGTVSALWSASSYLAVFRRALHAMHGVRDNRPAWRTAPRILATAVLLMVLLVCTAAALMITGSLAHAVGQLLGVGSAALTAWNVLKWPLLLALVTGLVLLLFRSGPQAARGLSRSAPGGLLAVLLWLVTSVGFTIYATRFGSYDQLYGSLAGAVIFLMWLWLSNLALLAGAQFNAELTRGAAPMAPRHARTRFRPEPGRIVQDRSPSDPNRTLDGHL